MLEWLASSSVVFVKVEVSLVYLHGEYTTSLALTSPLRSMGRLSIGRKDVERRYKHDLQFANGPVSRLVIQYEFVNSCITIAMLFVSQFTLFIQYAMTQRVQMTLGVPYPMFLEHTCTCNGTLCPHVIFTFNTSEWTTKRTGNGHQVDYNFPTFQDAWRLTNIAAQQRMLNTSKDGNLTVAEGEATALQLHTGSVCLRPGSHDPTLCRENGLDDQLLCTSRQGKLCRIRFWERRDSL